MVSWKIETQTKKHFWKLLGSIKLEMEAKAEDIWHQGLSRQTTHKLCVNPKGNSVWDHGLLCTNIAAE